VAGVRAALDFPENADDFIFAVSVSFHVDSFKTNLTHQTGSEFGEQVTLSSDFTEDCDTMDRYLALTY